MPHTSIHSNGEHLIQANNVGYQFSDGGILFSSISCSLSNRRTGLVGRNGCGKSLLAELLSGQRQPTSGTVTINTTLSYYSQLTSQWLESDQTIAQMLKLDKVLAALDRIEQGDCAAHLFDDVAERWDLKQQLGELLGKLGLPLDFDLPLRHLSGGQLARLQLWQLFESDSELLVLDEPSNHLDYQAKQWLVDKMRSWQGAILLISHDRTLLREMSTIWALNGGELRQYGGHYDDYLSQKTTHQQALDRQMNVVKTQLRRTKLEQQKNQEKADKRAAQGNKVRKQGGQPKILLNAMRNSAQASAANRATNQRGQSERLNQRLDALQAQQQEQQVIKMRLKAPQLTAKPLLNIINFTVPFSQCYPLNAQLSSGDKMWLMGHNGCGKSTLLQLINRQNMPELRCNCAVFYLDQHFSLLQPEHSLLDNLVHYCSHLNQGEARTLLAGIGFRRDEVHRLSGSLSGGEKMKLAMTIVGHQADSPLLLLDEPDNHLDLHSKQVLSQALKEYPAALILVSHDQEFVAEIGINRTVMFQSLVNNE